MPAAYSIIGTSHSRREEYVLGLNWFFDAHRNKLIPEVAALDFATLAAHEIDGWRFRLQWDVSI